MGSINRYALIGPWSHKLSFVPTADCSGSRVEIFNGY